MRNKTQNETVRRALEAIRLGNRKSPDRHREQAATEPVTSAHDPTAWREDFHRWALERCILRDRDDAGGIKFLWRDFNDWCIAHASVPCVYQTFERLLIAAGFELREGMTSGLVLLEDLENLQAFGPRPAEPEPPAQVKAEKQTRSAASPPRPVASPEIRIINYELVPPPIKLGKHSTVVNVEIFVRTTLAQLSAHLRGEKWGSGNWPRAELLDRLCKCGVEVEINELTGKVEGRE